VWATQFSSAGIDCFDLTLEVAA